MAKTPSSRSGELFTVERGRRVDARLHDALLGDVSLPTEITTIEELRKAAAAQRKIRAQRARRTR